MLSEYRLTSAERLFSSPEYRLMSTAGTVKTFLLIVEHSAATATGATGTTVNAADGGVAVGFGDNVATGDTGGDI